MLDEQWHDFSEKTPPPEGHIVTGQRRRDGTWCVTAIHPPGTGRDGRTPQTYWARLPDWIIQGPDPGPERP